MKKFLFAPLVLLFVCCLLPMHANASFTIGVLPASDSLALHVAQDEGLFRERGLEVELVPFQSALEQSAAIRGGVLHGWFTDMSMMLLMHESGVPQRVIATMSYSAPGSRFFGIAVAPGSSIASPEDLKGATISFSQGTIIEYMLDCMLKHKGFPKDFAKRVDIKQISVRLQLLLAGKTDAALLPEPLLSLVEAKGAKVIMDNTQLSMPLAITALRRDAADPETVKAFRAALVEAMRRINADPETYRKVMLDKKLLPAQAASAYQMLRFDPERTPTPLPTVRDMERVARWLVEARLLRKMPEAWDMLDDAQTR